MDLKTIIIIIYIVGVDASRCYICNSLNTPSCDAILEIPDKIEVQQCDGDCMVTDFTQLLNGSVFTMHERGCADFCFPGCRTDESDGGGKTITCVKCCSGDLCNIDANVTTSNLVPDSRAVAPDTSASLMLNLAIVFIIRKTF